MTFFLSKETLESFFRGALRLKYLQLVDDMSTVMQHRQVVLLISGLMSDLSPIIHLVYERWIRDGQKFEGKSLIEGMFHEAG